MRHISTKLFSGYSSCFRQWRATSHCAQLHGYSLEFKVWFEAEYTDEKNWVVDFGCFKQNGVKEWLNNMFDHTLLIAKDDPHLDVIKSLNSKGVAKVIVCNKIGAEAFAEVVFNYIDKIIKEETTSRVRVIKVECFENRNNSAIISR